METRNSGLLIHIRTKSTHPLGFTNVDGKVKLRRMKMNQINNSKKSISPKKTKALKEIKKTDENPIKTMTKLFSTKSLEICFLNSIFEFLAMKIPDNITPIEKAIDTSPKIEVGR